MLSITGIRGGVNDIKLCQVFTPDAVYLFHIFTIDSELLKVIYAQAKSPLSFVNAFAIQSAIP